MRNLRLSHKARLHTNALITGDSLLVIMDHDSQCLLETDFQVYDIRLNGAASAAIRGEGQALELLMTGASAFRGAELSCHEVQVRASGATMADVHALTSLTMTLTGNCSLTYFGEPQQVQSNNSGTNSVKQGHSGSRL